MTKPVIPVPVGTLYNKYKVIVASLILSVYCLPLLFNEPLVATLDGGWKRAMNFCIDNGLVFGRDIAFTYGPLGFLSTRYGEFLGKGWFLAFDAFLFTGFYYFFYKNISGRKDWFLITLFAMFLIRGSNYSQVLFLIFILYGALNFTNGLRNYFELIYCSFAGILLFFIKLNYGIVSLVILLLAAILLVKDRRAFLVFTGASLLSFGMIYFSVHLDIAYYIKYGLLLIGGYDEALSLPIEPFHFPFLLAILLMVTFLVIIAAYLVKLRKTNTLGLQPVIYILIAGLACYLFYKNGFTRADYWHWCDFFAIFPLFLVGVLIISGFGELRNAKIVAISGIVLSAYGSAYIQNESKLIGITGEFASYLANNISPVEYFAGMSRDLEEPINQNIVFPPDRFAQVGHSTVDVIPFDNMQLLYHNRFNYVPRPSLQSVYCETIDSLNAAHFQSDKRPDIVILKNIDIDNRYASWDESITKATLHLNYNYLNFLGSGNDSISPYSFLLLSTKAGSHVYPKFEQIGAQVVNMEEIIKINFPANEAIYMKADIQYPVGGKLKKFLYQAPALSMTIYYDDGTTKQYRAICPILKGRVLINKAITDAIELRNFITGNVARNRNITGVAFHPAGAGFEEKINLSFFRFSNY